MSSTGIINLNKPPGWTSHDAVARIRRLSGQKRVGHAGTLDPLAEGVLPILLGRATRLMDLIQGGRKRYLARVTLGASTTTDDAEGEITITAPVPALSPSMVEPALARFRGAIQQVPPAYSALKVQGRRAYAIARGGGTVDLPARSVTIHALELLDCSQDTLVLDITCGSGTYIRSLARDLAHALGTEGHLASLIRTEVGPFKVDAAVTPDQVAELGLERVLQPADAALPDAPVVHLDEANAARFRQGQPVLFRELEGRSPSKEITRIYDASSTLLGIGFAENNLLHPKISLLP